MIRTENTEGGFSQKLTRSARLYQKTSRLFVRHFPYAPSQQKYNITLSHEKKFIWFRVAKVGTRTIFDVLHRADITLDAEQAMFCHYPVEAYRDYFKFAFIRNPWDRLVSCWLNKVVENNYFGFKESDRSAMQNFANFVNLLSEIDINECDQHIRLQSRLIDLNNIDFIGRFENFERDLGTVANRLGIEPIQIRKLNTNRGDKHYSQYYNDKLIQIVADIYQRDIHLFSYNF
jgi:hypothetical protein